MAVAVHTYTWTYSPPFPFWQGTRNEQTLNWPQHLLYIAKLGHVTHVMPNVLAPSYSMHVNGQGEGCHRV